MNHDKLLLYSLLSYGEFNNLWGEVCKILNWEADIAPEWSRYIAQADKSIAAESSGKFTFGGKNVFAQIYGQECKDYFYPLSPISIEKNSVFGNVPSSIGKQERSDYLKGVATIIKSKLQNAKQGCIDSVLSTLQQHTWCLPFHISSKTTALPIYDVLKTRTALVRCLAEENVSNEYPYLLVSAELSGIQEFIYDIHSQKAAKSLKGRSFYLQMLIDAVLEIVLKETNCTKTQLVYASGGKFYAILPNTESNKKILSEIHQSIEESLLKKYETKLYIAMSYLEFNFDGNNYQSPEKNQKGNNVSGIGGVWEAITHKISRCKNTRFINHLSDKFLRFFESGEEGNDNNKKKICSVTGRFIEDYPVRYLDEENKEAPICKEVADQVDLGKYLRHARYYGFVFCTDDSITVRDKSYSAYHILDYIVGNEHKSIILELCDKESVQKLQTDNIWEINPQGLCNTNFSFCGGNQQAINKEGKIADFSDLVEKGGMNKLAVLRMDVDNLGRLFSGKEEGKLDYNFAALSHLSFMMTWFFSGYLNTIRNEEKFKNNVNILYAGGDDMFVVGDWEKVIDFATKVREAFSKFTGLSTNTDNLRLGISAGIVLVNPKFPISKAADMAGDAEQKAKKFGEKDGNEAKKNAICLLGDIVSWKDEWEIVLELKEDFIKNLKGSLSNGVLYRLLDFQKQCKQGKFNWYWESAYFFARHKDSFSKNSSEAAFLGKLTEAFVTGRINNLKKQPAETLNIICLAAKLAHYNLREA